MSLDLTQHLAWFRYALLLLTLVWALLALRAGHRGALLGGLLFAGAALGSWIALLGRPYGLLVDPGTTRRLAALAVVAASGDAQAGPLAGEPLRADEAAIVRLAVFGDRASWIPTVLPLLVLPALGLLAYGFGPSPRRGLAAVLWLGFSTGDLDTVRGLGFIPGMWSHPLTSVLLVALVAVAVAAGRLPRGSFGIGLGLAAVGSWGFVSASAAPRGLLETLLVLTIDQGLWVLPGFLGLARGGPPAAVALSLGGAALLVAGATGLPIDAWGAHAFYRLGLLLAAVAPLGEGLDRIEPALSKLGRKLGGGPVGVALLIAVLVPGSFLMRWNPKRLDPIFEASLEPVAASLAAATDWIRDHTERDAVLMAGPFHAPAVAARAGRRVLRAPTLVPAPDDERRLRLEKAVIEGRAVEDLRRRYGLRYVLVAPGDFREHGLERPEELANRGLRLVYEGAGALRVYAVQ